MSRSQNSGLLYGVGFFDEKEDNMYSDGKIKIKALILPKFEIGALSGDEPGEAQLYYEAYLQNGDTYEITGGYGKNQLHVKNGTALYVTGIGKVNAALSAMAVLTDPRFDFSEAFILSTGCGGAAKEYGVMGDVFVVSSAVDYDLGHHADPRELKADAKTAWFHAPEFDDSAAVFLNPALTERVYDIVKDIPLQTTERTRAFLAGAFPQEAWAQREPRVLRGAAVSGDNYWKGELGHNNAVLMTRFYGCPDPYAVSEMEDAAVGTALKRLGLLDRYIIIRGAANMDVFMGGATAENLWGPADGKAVFDGGQEAADLFEICMRNTFRVGSAIISAILNGTLEAVL